MSGKKIIVGVTGASGSVYAKVLFDRLIELEEQIEDVGVVFSFSKRRITLRFQPVYSAYIAEQNSCLEP